MASFIPPSAARYASMFGASCDFSDAIISCDDEEDIEVDVIRSVRDVDENKRRKWTYPLKFSNKHESWKQNRPYEHGDNCSFVGVSPSGEKSIRILSSKDKGNTTNIVSFEIWHGSNLKSRIKSKLHDKVYPSSPGGLGGLSWSKDETKIIYVAEKKNNDPISFFNPNNNSNNNSNNDSNNEKGEETILNHHGEEYDLRNDWGEQLIGSDRISLFCLNLISQDIIEMKACTQNGKYTPSQPLFSDDGTCILYVAYPNHPKKLGLIYCIQRPCQIHHLSLNDEKNEENNNEENAYKNITILTEDDKIAVFPRLNHKGDKLVYLSSKGFDTHCGPLSLKVASVHSNGSFVSSSTSSSSPIVYIDALTCHPIPDKDTMNNETTTTLHGFSFPGFWFPSGLPEKCWNFDDSKIWFTSFWGSTVSSFYLDLESGKIIHMNPSNIITSSTTTSAMTENNKIENLSPYASLMVITSLPNSNGVLAKWSTPTDPGGIVLIKSATSSGSTSESTSESWKWFNAPSLGRQVVTCANMNMDNDVEYGDRPLNELFVWKLLSLVPPDSETNIPIEGILIVPKQTNNNKDGKEAEGEESKSLGLIVVPHGGPHSTSSTSFLSSYLFLAKETNCAILHVNYRGSIGFGSQDLNSLPGKVGTQDVADMVLMTNHVISLFSTSNSTSSSTNMMIPSNFNKNHIGVVGGSHGGFLGAHLIGQHHDLFKVSALRNPVINMASMCGISDIPDWCSIEALGIGQYDFDQFNAVPPESLKIMFEKSPIAHVDKVKAPTLIALGAKDRRVPSSQGVEYYHILKARGIQTRLLVYPEDCHPIDKPASEGDHWINIAQWMDVHIRETKVGL